MSLLTDTVQGTAASCAALVFSNPFEVVKSRLQLQGELQKRGHYSRHYRGVLHGLETIARNEGFRATQKGFDAALLHQISQNGIRFGLYPLLTARSQSVVGDGARANIIASAAAGAVGAVAGTPAQVIKVRLQSSCAAKAMAVGEQHEYRNAADAMRKIVASEGVKGLWRGVRTAMVRTAVFSMTQLASYDVLKGAAVGIGYDPARPAVHIVCAVGASAVMTLITNPFELVFTRTCNSSANTDRVGWGQRFASVVRAEGVSGLYKGSSSFFARVGTHTVCTFLILEQIRRVHANYTGTSPRPSNSSAF